MVCFIIEFAPCGPHVILMDTVVDFRYRQVRRDAALI